MSSDEKEVIHDYSGVDKYLEELIQREEETSREAKSKNKVRSAKGALQRALEALVILLGLGLFAVLIAFAIRLIIYQPLG